MNYTTKPIVSFSTFLLPMIYKPMEYWICLVEDCTFLYDYIHVCEFFFLNIYDNMTNN